MCLVLGFLLVSLAIAEPAPRAESVEIDVWTTRQGLPQHSVNGLVQSSDGLVWLATFGGITSFDGRRFQVEHIGSDPALTANRFRDVVERPDGSLWFAAEDQGLLRLHDGQFEVLWSKVSTYDLAEGPDGLLWSASQRGAHIWTDDGPTLVMAGPLRSIVPLKRGVVIGVTPSETPTCVSGPCALVDRLLEVRPLTRVSEALDGAILAATQTGLKRLDGDRWRTIGPPRTLHVQWRGLDWMFDGEWLTSLDGSRRVEIGPSLHPRTKRTPGTTSLVDREGGLWLGTRQAGLVRLHEPDAAWLSSDTGVSDVAYDRATQQVYFSNCIQGVRLADPIRDRKIRGPECPGLWEIAPGTIWVHGRNGRGGGVVGPLGGPLAAKTAKPVAAANAGPWFASGTDLWRIPPSGRPEVVLTGEDIDAEVLWPLRGDNADHVWIYADRRWLLELHFDEIVRRVELPDGGSVRDVTRLDDLVVVGTYGGGILLVRGDQVVRRLTPEDGLCDHAVSHFFRGPGNRVWFNSNRGIGVIPHEDLHRAATDLSAPIDCVLVTHAEGNGRSGTVTPDGTLIVPTLFGVQAVDPLDTSTVTAPSVVITAARYGDQDLLAEGAEVFGPADLTVRVSGVHFDAPSSIRYRHRLVGLDDRWSRVTTTNALSWTDLPPGRYRFEVRARARDGLWSPATTLTIERRAAWFERATVRWGAPVLAVLLMMGALSTALARTRVRNRRLRDEIEQRERAEHRLRWQQRENERVRRMLEATRRLEALGRLSGGIAHDFNNLMAAASGFAEPLTQHPDDDVVESGRVIMDMVARGATLTSQLLALGHRRESTGRPADVGQTIESIAPMLRRLIREDVAIEVDVVPGLYARIELGLLEQIVTNLATNARDAIDGPGRIQIRSHRDLRDGTWWVVLDVTDNGRGLSPEMTEQIFDPYFTTKDMSRGTGLGLATVQRAAHEAGGSVEVRATAVGHGTTMRVWLPEVALGDPVDDHDLDEGPTEVELPTVRILVVDDDASVMRATMRLLRASGHEVVGASDLKGAVAVVRSHPIDLLLTDVLLPYATGIDVRDAVREVLPNLPVVFITGHAGELIDSLSDEILVTKPFTGERLLHAVAQCLAHAQR